MLNHDRRGTGEPLVLVHGIGSRWQVFAPVLDRLAAAHDVIALDMPGFAGSAPLPGRTDITALTDAVEAFARDLGLERWHVAGNSTGGGVALELAHRGVVASATAVSPIGFWSSRERAFCQGSLAATRVVASAMRNAGLAAPVVSSPVGRTLTMGQTFARPWRLSGEDALADLEDFLDCPAFADTSAAFTGYVAPFDHGDVPVTVAWGTRDRLLLPRQARRARRVMPRATHVWLQGCGHAPFADDPSQVAEVLLAGAAARG